MIVSRVLVILAKVEDWLMVGTLAYMMYYIFSSCLEVLFQKPNQLAGGVGEVYANLADLLWS